MLAALALAAALLGGPLADLEAVQAGVNSSMSYRPDPAGRDVWTTGGKFGDCEDFALTKRAALLALGHDPRDLRVVLGFDWRGIRHAVLFARDERGTWWVLDNQNATLRTPASMKREGASFDAEGPYSAPR